jgi:hypothetical protein
MTDKQIVLMAGAVCVAFGLIFLVVRILFVRRAVTTQGTVTDLESHHDSEDGTTYTPVVSFVTADGQPIQFRSHVSSNPPSHQVGEMVPVKYLADKPQKAKMGTAPSLWWAPGLVLLVGAGLLIWGFLFQRDDGGAAETAGNAPGLARTLPSGQTRLSVVNQSDSEVLTAECVSIRDTQQGTTREVALRLQGDKTLTLKVTPYTGPKAYTVPIGASVGGTIFEETQSPSGAVVFSGNGQNGVVNISALPLSVSGNWDCTTEELRRS